MYLFCLAESTKFVDPPAGTRQRPSLGFGIPNPIANPVRAHSIMRTWRSYARRAPRSCTQSQLGLMRAKHSSGWRARRTITHSPSWTARPCRPSRKMASCGKYVCVCGGGGMGSKFGIRGFQMPLESESREWNEQSRKNKEPFIRSHHWQTEKSQCMHTRHTLSRTHGPHKTPQARARTCSVLSLITLEPGRMAGRDDSDIELSGVSRMASISGCTIEPPPPIE